MRPTRQYRHNAPGVATRLNSRFVGVTAVLGTRSTSSCTGSRNTRSETPTGAVTAAMMTPAANAAIGVTALDPAIRLTVSSGVPTPLTASTGAG